MSATDTTAVTCGECKFMFFGADAVAQYIEHPCAAAGTYDAAKPEPPPVVNDREAIQDLVVEDIRARKAKGIKEYGTPLQAFNGRDALNDLYQEMLDAIFYLRQTIYERDAWRKGRRISGPVAAQLYWQGHETVDDECSCGCTASFQCGKDGCPHEQP